MRFICSIALLIVLSGCAATYTFDGQRYQTKEEFLAVVDSKYSAAVGQIQPLPQPVSRKTLVFATFSEPLIFRESAAMFSRANGRPIGVGEEMVQRNVWTSTYKGLKVFYDVIKRKNIYAQVRYVELDSMTATLEPSAAEDVLYLNQQLGGQAQWYYGSAHAGKQAFGYDRGGATMSDRLKSFADAVQVYAIRD
jgi:hypothetical protein